MPFNPIPDARGLVLAGLRGDDATMQQLLATIPLGQVRQVCAVAVAMATGGTTELLGPDGTAELERIMMRQAAEQAAEE